MPLKALLPRLTIGEKLGSLAFQTLSGQRPMRVPFGPQFFERFETLPVFSFRRCQLGLALVKLGCPFLRQPVTVGTAPLLFELLGLTLAARCANRSASVCC